MEIKTKREKDKCLARGNCPDLVILEHVDRGTTFRHREGIRGVENFRGQGCGMATKDGREKKE